jgi:hypothetical protein
MRVLINSSTIIASRPGILKRNEKRSRTLLMVVDCCIAATSPFAVKDDLTEPLLLV